MVDLVKKINENEHHINRDFEDIRKNISEDRDHFVIQLNEQNAKFESIYNSVDNKVDLIETKFIAKVWNIY